MTDPISPFSNATQSLPLHLERRGDVDLLPVVVQDHVTGEVRMLAWATLDAVRATVETGHATFYSRSRRELWEKGKTSGHTLDVVSILVDCDADALVYLVDPRGPTCHTGAPSCFFRRLTRTFELETPVLASTLLARLDATLLARKASTSKRSYVKSLYDGGSVKIGQKLREEADELANAVAHEDEKRVVSEAADVLFHVMVALRSRNVGIDAVLHELSRREGTSGHEEKKQRKT